MKGIELRYKSIYKNMGETHEMPGERVPEGTELVQIAEMLARERNEKIKLATKYGLPPDASILNIIQRAEEEAIRKAMEDKKKRAA